MRLSRLAPLVLVLLLALAPAGAAQAVSPPGDAAAKKKAPKCKAGANKKKCRCPKGSKLKKTTNRKGKKVFRCKATKKPQPVTPEPVTPGPVAPGPVAPEPAPVTPEPAPEGAQPVRNDQALKDALTNAAARKLVSSGGYSSYTYNFLPDALGEAEGLTLYRLRYCTFSWYPGFGNSRDNYDGAWVIKEGFTRPDQPAMPGLVTGNIYLYRQGMPEDQVVDAGVAVYQNEATIQVGSGSTYFEGGDFAFKPGEATTDCAQWED